MINKLAKYLVLVAVLFCLAPDAEPAEAAGWDYDLGIYLWALGMNGPATVRGFESDVDIGFSEIFDNLEMASSTHF